MTMTDDEYREAARKEYQREGEIEIDDEAEVSRANEVGGDDGAYVQAWVWVANEEDEEG